MASVISVKQLNSYVKSLLEADARLSTVYVSGEISNFKCHFASGHLYFSLKDDSAVVKAVMFRSAASKLAFTPENGMNVICRGRVSVYERDGNFQLYVESIEPDGAGSLAVAFEQLKTQLASEGLFDISRKKPIPKFPKKIAVVTSADAAALRDIVNIISRRCPLTELLIAPVQVQGEGAPTSIIAMLNRLYLRDDIDLIIVGRGGGSAEDLWCFNNEELARTIFSSSVPIISAVGHETDFTISDFVADLRAPTPSVAAELAVPDLSIIKQSISAATERMRLAFIRSIEEKQSLLEALSRSQVLRCSDRVMAPFVQRADTLSKQLVDAENNITDKALNNLSSLAGRLDALSPLKVIARGYTITKNDKGKTVRSVDEVSCGDKLNVAFFDGIAECSVDKIIK